MMMRRINKLAVLSRAIDTGATTTTTTTTTQHRLIQRASFSTASASSVKHPVHWFSNRFVEYVAPSVAGTVLFSAAASSMAHEVHAKEARSKNFVVDEVVLYQYEACPFCNKLKAFLDYYDIPYKVVEVNPISKSEIKWSDYKKVPILTVDGQQMNDSSAIIDTLYAKVRPEKVTYNDEEEKQWRGWVDSHLVHMLSPNIYRSRSEALEAFDYITTHGNFSFYERVVGKYAGAAAMYFISKKLKKRHNITDERESLYEAANTWVSALNGREFLGGAKPNLADLAVFGVLRPIRHLRSGKDMVEHTRIGEWYSRMENAVGESSRINA